MVPKPRPNPTRAIRTPREDDVFVRTAHAAACPLGPIEAQVLARMDGDTPVGDIAVLLNLSVRETAMVVARLLELGAIESPADVDAKWESREDAVTKPPPKPTDD
ncbi:MAG: hypothetical protein HYV09_07310 [Deltaproteobacteria bacterium]|nr:hypothetical protein [Deltaproteobacteria bacterium]